MRSYWIERGSKKCQHLNHGFEKSRIICGNEPHSRYCSTSLFTCVHPLTGECLDRAWLCYSPTSFNVYCFACKLFPSSSCKFTSGYNYWKHGEDRVSSHENGPPHRKAMIILSNRKAASGRIDASLVQQYATVIETCCHCCQIPL